MQSVSATNMTSDRRQLYYVVAVILAAFVIAELVLFCYHSVPMACRETDGIGYMKRARGPLFHIDPYHMPAYSLAIRVVQKTGADAFSAAKFVSALFGLITVYSTWLVLSAVTRRREALIGTAVLALNPLFLFRTVTILSDLMATGFYLLAIATTLVPRRLSVWHLLLSGIFVGLAYMTRSIYIIGFAIPVMVLLLGSGKRSPKVIGFAAFLVGFLLLTLPWFILLWRATGNPFWNYHYLNVVFKMYREAEGWNAFPSQSAYHGWSDVIFSEPTIFFKSWFQTLINMPGRLLETVPRVGAIGALGCLLWISHLNKRKLIWICVSVAYALVVSLVWIETRFLLPLMPLVAAFVAAGIAAIPAHFEVRNLSHPLGKILKRIPLRSVVIGVVLTLLIGQLIFGVQLYFSDEAPEYRTAGEWLANVSTGKVRIMSAKPHIAFFADAEHMSFRTYQLQDIEIDQLPAVLDRAQPTHLVYDARYAAGEFPHLKRLLDSSSNPFPNVLRAIYEIRSPKRLVIYQYLATEEADWRNEVE